MTSEVAQPWITAEIVALLQAIRPPHVDKKRATAIRVAVARATPGVSEDSVFQDDDPQICARSTWYGKWKHEPAIATVVAACEQRLRDWRDAETLRIEAQAQQLLRRAIAEGQIDAVTGLRRTALSQTDRADHRTEASVTLLTLGSDELAARLLTLRRGNPLTVEVENLDALIESELARVAGGGEGDVARATAGTPDGGAPVSAPESH